MLSSSADSCCERFLRFLVTQFLLIFFFFVYLFNLIGGLNFLQMIQNEY